MSEELSGRELELEVAKRVFGFRWFHCAAANGVERNQFFSPETAETWRGLDWTLTEIDGPQEDQFNDDTAAPKFARSIEAAMRIVEKMRDLEWSVYIQRDCGATFWDVSFTAGERIADEDADTLPLAICKAALAAIENKHD